MYYLLKLIQAVGLAVIIIGFLINFPKIMNMKMLAAGICIFTFGWILQRTMLKK